MCSFDFLLSYGKYKLGFFLPKTKLEVGLAVFVAQLVERSHPTPEICSSNPNIYKPLSTNFTLIKDD